MIVEMQPLRWVIVVAGIAQSELVDLRLHVQVGVDAYLRLGLHLVRREVLRGERIDGNCLHRLLDVIESLLVWLHLINMFLILLLKQPIIRHPVRAHHARSPYAAGLQPLDLGELNLGCSRF